MMTNRTERRYVPPRMAFGVVLVAALATMTAAQQPSRPAPIFRLATFQTNGDLRLGATQGNGESEIVDIHNAVRALAAMGAPEVRSLGYIPADMKTLIEVGDSAVAAVKTVYRAALALKAGGKLVDPGGEQRVFYPHSAVRLRAPIPNPRQLFGMAGNYRREGTPERQTAPGASSGRTSATPAANPSGLGRAPNPNLPSFFLKSVSGIVGPDDEIVMTDLLKDGFPNTHEAEMAVVIGKRAKNVPESSALDYVFGYTVHNDVSGRTLETGASSSEGSSMTKGMDTFAPLGPYLTLKEDVPDPYNLAIETKLNGKVFPMPNAHTKYMEHRIPAALSLLSRIMTLQPGDILATGVPAPTAPLVSGDTVEITIERLGTLRNRVVKRATGSTF
jgi:2-keto-4-pentenoate hydratase/2-oxohepta-3-ene-1,7-dioic acid hydratase in catechol pathway